LEVVAGHDADDKAQVATAGAQAIEKQSLLVSHARVDEDRKVAFWQTN
jgi:hypothetical protein